ncbi:MAG: hypothetical protein HC771_24875 [Synechococcales cyanobacterium CRU_2_2]|nr:hypothetical protein [Synechococcales cyanobacterium CRU_2_2]
MTEPLGVDSDLSYRITTSQDGTVLGYVGMDEISKQNASRTPLLDQLYIPPRAAALRMIPWPSSRLPLPPMTDSK